MAGAIMSGFTGITRLRNSQALNTGACPGGGPPYLKNLCWLARVTA